MLEQIVILFFCSETVVCFHSMRNNEDLFELMADIIETLDNTTLENFQKLIPFNYVTRNLSSIFWAENNVFMSVLLHHISLVELISPGDHDPFWIFKKTDLS